ncbi:hypothetical protein EV356DRAFT_117035 [Viridothelium virens]|uniref:Uncharacterized protein n=1 Tax=Viridothelium virens TaxID=1048519 RepID=A0A6A6GRW3_VIRVR|nr:hypothetical protein EV356DRAFT_117035 [Viridothelium virens]
MLPLPDWWYTSQTLRLLFRETSNESLDLWVPVCKFIFQVLPRCRYHPSFFVRPLVWIWHKGCSIDKDPVGNRLVDEMRFRPYMAVLVSGFILSQWLGCVFDQSKPRRVTLWV